MGKTAKEVCESQVSEILDCNVGPGISLWRVPNIPLGHADRGVGVLPHVQVRAGGRSGV